MYQVYGLKNVKYYHVGSPKFRCVSKWGDVFAHEADCQRACDALKAQYGVQFLSLYPREVAQPQEKNFDDPDHDES